MSMAFFLRYWNRRFHLARQASAQRTIDQHRHLLRSRNPSQWHPAGGAGWNARMTSCHLSGRRGGTKPPPALSAPVARQRRGSAGMHEVGETLCS
jgi:hypothetical protein